MPVRILLQQEFSDRMAHNLQEHRGEAGFAWGGKVGETGGQRQVERVVTDQGCYERPDMVVFPRYWI